MAHPADTQQPTQQMCSNGPAQATTPAAEAVKCWVSAGRLLGDCWVGVEERNASYFLYLFPLPPHLLGCWATSSPFSPYPLTFYAGCDDKAPFRRNPRIPYPAPSTQRAARRHS